MTRPAELRDVDEDELATRLTEARQELFNLRFQHVTGQLDNYARLGQIRKDIARINTILREREIDAADAEAAAASADQAAADTARRARVEASRRKQAEENPNG